jgi:hypothetical protein
MMFGFEAACELEAAPPTHRDKNVGDSLIVMEKC